MRRKYRATMPSWKSELRKSMPPADNARYPPLAEKVPLSPATFESRY